MPTLLLYFQIPSHGFDPLEDLWRNPIKKGPLQIRQDMGGRAGRQNLFVLFLEDAILKDQFGHFRSLHRGLNDQRIAEGGRKFKLTRQFNHGCQQITCFELKRAHVETMGQVVSADLEPAYIMTMPRNAVGINLIKSDLKGRPMISHLLLFQSSSPGGEPHFLGR